MIPLCDLELNPLAGYDATHEADGYFYDAAKAQRAVDFFPTMLSHVKQSKFTRARAPFKLADWQDEATRLMFGCVDKDGLRRYRVVYIEVGRKNGKTTFAAGLAAYGLFADGEDGAECYCAAADRDQAALLYNVLAGMIRQNTTLANNCKIRDSVKRVIYGGSYLKAISSEANTKHGFNSHFIICDELHAWRGRELWDVLKTSTGARAQPMIIVITTAGTDRHSICWELHEYAKKVRDKKIHDPQFLPILYSVDENADWKDETNWKLANPNYGISIDPEYMKAQCREAQNNPAYENTFRNLHLSQWTSQTTRWIQMDAWRKCCGEAEFDPMAAKPVGGLDLSSTTDISAWSMVQRDDDGFFRVKWRFYLPEAMAERAEKTDGVPYRRWAEAGLVTLTRGNRIDYATIKRDVLADCEEYGIRQIGVDPWNADYMVQELQAEGLDIVNVRQGFASLSQPSKQLEAAIADGTLLHGGNAAAEWQADNVEVDTDANGNIRPVKPKHAASGKRIDGIVATVIALAVLLEEDPASPVFDYYESHDLELA